MAKSLTRSVEIKSPDMVFPALLGFTQPTKLPLTRDVIGVLRGIQEDPSKCRPIAEVCWSVADMIYSKYHHDTVYCISIQRIAKKLDNDWKIFKDCRKRVFGGRTSGKEVQKCIGLANKADKLYEVAAVTTDRKEKCKKEWGVEMGVNEKNHLLDQRTSRLQECDNGVDTLWWSLNQRKLKQVARKDQWEKDKT